MNSLVARRWLFRLSARGLGFEMRSLSGDRFFIGQSEKVAERVAACFETHLD